MDRTPAPGDSSHKPLAPGWALLFIVFDAYLLIGAYVLAATRKWPIFMPGQFDFFALFLGSWVGGALLLVIGGYCVWVGYVALRRIS